MSLDKILNGNSYEIYPLVRTFIHNWIICLNLARQDHGMSQWNCWRCIKVGCEENLNLLLKLERGLKTLLKFFFAISKSLSELSAWNKKSLRKSSLSNSSASWNWAFKWKTECSGHLSTWKVPNTLTYLSVMFLRARYKNQIEIQRCWPHNLCVEFPRKKKLARSNKVPMALLWEKLS